MPPSSPPGKPIKPYFFYGHRRPSQNRPVVYGGLFSSRKTIAPPNPSSRSRKDPIFELHKWDPHTQLQNLSHSPKSKSETTFATSQRLSPIARFITDAFRKNSGRWGPAVVADLNKLRRVTPDLVVEILKVETNPTIASKLFHWAGKQKGYKHTFAAYNAFAYCLNRSNKFRAADQMPELMDSQGKPPTEKQFEILIRMHIDANRGLRVFYVYEKMKKFGVKPRVFLYNRIIDGLVKTDHFDLALSVYKDFKDDGLVEDSVTYTTMMKGLCKAGRIDEMLEILGKMRTNLCKPDIFAYTALFRILISEGNLDGCLRVWEEMKRDKVGADVMAYGTLITGFCKGRRVDKALELFKEMRKSGLLIDRSIYGALIEAFVVDGKVGLACDMFKDLVDSGYRADLGIYNSLIEGLCSVKRVDKAHMLFQDMVREEIQPDFLSVNPMLVLYAEMRKMDDFIGLLVQMKNLGFSVLENLSNFFSCLVRKEETNRIMMALEVFEDLEEKGYCSTSIYNVMMGALLKIGEVKRVISLFNEIKNSSFKPDSTTYSHAISCMIEDDAVEEACIYYNKVIEMTLLPSIDAYYSLATGLCRIGELDAATMLVRDCLGNVSSAPMEFKYYLAVIHACKSTSAEKVVEVLEEMTEQNCPPTIVAYSAIIYGMAKHGTIEEGRKVFSSLKERRFLSEAECIVYDDKLVEETKKKTADLVRVGLKFFGLESKLRSKGFNLLPN